MNTQSDILTLLISSMEQSIEYKRRLYADIPIQDQFDNVFNEFTFAIGTFIFKLESDYWIPADLDDYSLTFREFAEEVAKHRKEPKYPKEAKHPKEAYPYRKHWQN